MLSKEELLEEHGDKEFHFLNSYKQDLNYKGEGVLVSIRPAYRQTYTPIESLEELLEADDVIVTFAGTTIYEE